MLLAFVVGGLGFEFCVFVAGWRHALRSDWPFLIIITRRGAAAYTQSGPCDALTHHMGGAHISDHYEIGPH